MLVKCANLLCMKPCLLGVLWLFSSFKVLKFGIFLVVLTELRRLSTTGVFLVAYSFASDAGPWLFSAEHGIDPASVRLSALLAGGSWAACGCPEPEFVLKLTFSVLIAEIGRTVRWGRLSTVCSGAVKAFYWLAGSAKVGTSA